MLKIPAHRKEIIPLDQSGNHKNKKDHQNSEEDGQILVENQDGPEVIVDEG
jgi:hypothetical protein